jgi:hypothetical protein
MFSEVLKYNLITSFLLHWLQFNQDGTRNKKITKNNNEFQHKVELLKIGASNSFNERRITNLLQITKVSNNLEEECANIGTILIQAEKESLGEKKR